jgi:hypothetical protein
MNNPTYSVQKIESHKHLPCYFLHKIKGKPFVIVSLEYLEKIDTQDFEDHTEMIAIWTFIEERVEEVKYMTVISIELLFVRLVLFQRFNPLRMISKTGNFLQYLNLSCLYKGLLRRKRPPDSEVNSS